MKKILLTIVAVVGALTASAQLTPNRIIVPDIEGYKTLKGDFHIHTVFTDASVWPVTRVTRGYLGGPGCYCYYRAHRHSPPEVCKSGRIYR